MNHLKFDPYLLSRAKAYLLQNRIPFFDFFRDTVLGFVETGERRGFYVAATITELDLINRSCNCRDANKGLICEHMIALCLKAWNWPFENRDLIYEFDNSPIQKFLKEVPPKVLRMELTRDTNPALTVPKSADWSRFTDYLFNDEKKLALRDQKAHATALRNERTAGENQMIARDVPSRKCLYEDSRLFMVSKWAFFLQNRDALEWELRWLKNHQVQLTLSHHHEAFFDWTLDIAKFLSIAKNSLPFWEKSLGVGFKSQALSTKYKISFDPDGALLIQPGIGLDHFVPLTELEKVDRMYFHPQIGYFFTQIGLSEFELTHASSPLARIEKKKVPSFLKKFRQDLDQLDRQFIDEGLYGKILSDRVDKVQLELYDYGDLHFSARISFSIGDQDVDMSKLQGENQQTQNRYWDFNQRFFDSRSMDGHILKSILQHTKGERLSLPCQSVFQAILYFGDRMEVKTNELSEASYTRMKAMHVDTKPDLTGSNLQLRPYQESGLKWLWFLYNFGLGGLLCDQMGLGKTHQGMALIQAIKNIKKDVQTLVVCPTGVLFHWEEKLAQFCPELSVSRFHGPQRNVHESLKSDIILTTYGTVRNSQDSFSGLLFDLLITDEIQNIKNTKTRAHQSLKQIKAVCRIGLTGTPIENSLHDLKSTMDSVLPGYLGNDQLFKDGFEVPITQFKSESARKQLKSLIQPFMLRRSKSEVLKDLPEKIEDIRVFRLSSMEQELYDEIKKEGKARIESGERVSALHIFQVINSLKQFCNHPALFYGHHDYNSYPSQKWDIFTALLQETLAGGEKLVVFTQYLGMIEFFKSYLQHHSIGYACITGKVTKRQQEQNRFQTDPDCSVFIGTLGAAGVGIDLTAASVLIHYDRWWNPAREEQGTDRIHRIGQEKSVQIYKLMAKGTIEERIDQLISRKKDLLEEIIEFDSEQAIKRLSVEDLLEVLS